MKAFKTLSITLAILVAAIGLTVLVTGLLLPAERTFANEIEIDAPADMVWQVIADKRRYTEWQTQLESVHVIDDENWVEHAKDAPEPLRFRLVRDSRPTRLELEYTMGDLMSGRWIGEIEPTPTGVRLRTIDSYKVDGWMTKILTGVFFDLDDFAKGWNMKLKQRAEKLTKNSEERTQ